MSPPLEREVFESKKKKYYTIKIQLFGFNFKQRFSNSHTPNNLVDLVLTSFVNRLKLPEGQVLP